MAKDSLRREILAARKLQTESHVCAASNKISKSLIKSSAYCESDVVALYYPFRNEVDLLSLLESGERTFVFPKVVKDTRTLDFYKVCSSEDFIKGAYGIMEPDCSLEKVNIHDIDLFAVPGVAFSKNGERIGYGGGYYDSTLSFRKTDSIAVGISFEMQVVDPGFSNEQDIPVDILITEKKIYFCNDKLRS